MRIILSLVSIVFLIQYSIAQQELEVSDTAVVSELVEKVATFVGGEDAMSEYLIGNIRFPELARDCGATSKVIVEFIVEKDGSINNVKALRNKCSVIPSDGMSKKKREKKGISCDSVCDLFEEEAVRVIKEMPKWNPGSQRGKNVRVKFRLPIMFKLV